jgi:hypothetical protein
VTLSYSQAATDDGPAILAFYAPKSYVAKFSTTAGSIVGTATGNAVAGDMRGATLPLDGTIRVAQATAPVAPASTTTVGGATALCSGTTQLAATWSLILNGFNMSIPLAIGVQKIESGPMAGSFTLFVCPPPADVPAGAVGGSPLGMKIVRLTLRLTNAFTVPAGTHVWHLKATPYVTGSMTANAAGAAEAEAHYALPQQLTLTTKASSSNRSSVSGRLTLAGKGVAGRTVRILAGGKQVGSAETSASGAFATTVTIKPHALVTAKVVVPATYSACAQPVFAPLPCTTIVSGFATTASARVP